VGSFASSIPGTLLPKWHYEATGGVLFFFLTQDFPVQSLLPILSGTGLFGLPVIREFVTRLGAGERSSTPSQNA
jgi:hypothetical protein